MTLLKDANGTAGTTYSSLASSIADATSKLPTISVATYGALGDNSHDDTTAINSAITAANALASSTKRIQVYFPDGVYLTDGMIAKSNVWLNFGNAYIKKRVNGTTQNTNSLLRTTQTIGAGYSTPCSNLKITGGTLDSNSHTNPAHIISLYFTEDLEIDGVTAIQTLTNQTWAFAVGGKRGHVRNCKVMGGTTFFQDGIHIMHGQHWRVDGNHVESGDDAFAVGSALDDAYLAAVPDPCRYITFTNNTCIAMQGNAFRLYCGTGATAPNWEITDVTVQGLTGTAGVTRNGGILLEDVDDHVAGSALMKRISINNVEIKVGSATTDETNPFGIDIQSCSDVSLSNVDLQLTEKSVPVTGFMPLRIDDSEDVTVSKYRCETACKNVSALIRDSNRVTIKDSVFRGSTTAANEAVKCQNATDFTFQNNVIREILQGSTGLSISNGTTNSGFVLGNRFFSAAGATTTAGLSVSSATYTSLTVANNDFTGVPVAANTGSLYILGKTTVRGNRALLDYGFLGPRVVQAIATDAIFTLTVGSSGEHILHTGTLTANRAVTLSTTGAAAGNVFRITRTGAGAFTLDVGTGPLKSLATNTWCEVMYNGSAWVLAAYGAL